MRTLTIAIPTFERHESLSRSLPVVLQQVEAYADQVEVLIIDNHSTRPVEETVRPLSEAHPSVAVRVIRNRTNVGAHANTLRCFENTETPWMWLLGDDDLVAEGGLTRVLDSIKENPEANFINFTYEEFDRPAAFTTSGQEEFVRGLDSFTTVLFMSLCVFRMEAYLPNLRFGYLYAYSWAPHIGLTLLAMKDGGKARFETSKLIGVHTLEDRKGYWSVLNVMMGIPVLADLPMNAETRKAFAQFLGKQLQMEQLPYHLIQNVKRDGDLAYALYTYDHIVHRNFYFGTSAVRRLKGFFYRFLVRYPNTGEKLIKFGYPLIAKRLAKGKSLDQIDVPARWGRV